MMHKNWPLHWLIIVKLILLAREFQVIARLASLIREINYSQKFEKGNYKWLVLVLIALLVFIPLLRLPKGTHRGSEDAVEMQIPIQGSRTGPEMLHFW